MVKVQTAPLTPFHKLGVSGLRLAEAPFGSCDLLLYFCRGSTDFLICLLYQLGKRQFDVRGNSIYFRDSLFPNFVQKGRKRIFVEPSRRFRNRRNWRKGL